MNAKRQNKWYEWKSYDIPQRVTSKSRAKFIGRERDAESRLGDHGVRKYDYELGRFTSIDPLWEKYYEWTPYHYSRNNPLILKDDNGRDVIALIDWEGAATAGHMALLIGNDTDGWGLYSKNGGSLLLIGNRIDITTGYSNPDDFFTYQPDPFHGPNWLKERRTEYADPSKKDKVRFYDYNPNGSLTRKLSIDITEDPPDKFFASKLDYFDYDVNSLLEMYWTFSYTSINDTCVHEPPFEMRTEWRYWYNPFNEREQKRMYHSPEGDVGMGTYPWVYYHLGTGREQYAVYHGTQFSDPQFYSNGPFGSIITCDNPQPSVYYYLSEYNTYGSSGVDYSVKSGRHYDPNYSMAWHEEFNITDHLGNVRVVVRKDPLDPKWFAVQEQYDYKPYGGLNTNSDTKDSRLKFIGKERDAESRLGDHGVRKYDYELGRFTSIDPLWEKYYAWTPYHYSRNNPLSNIDPDGKRDFTQIQGAGNSEGEKQTIYTIRNSGPNSLGGKYATGHTDKVWHIDGNKGYWMIKSDYIQKVINPIVEDTYTKGPTNVNLLKDHGIDANGLISQNFLNMLDIEIENNAEKGSSQYWFPDNERNPFVNDAVDNNEEIMLGPMMGPVAKVLGTASNVIVNQIATKIPIPVGEKYQEMTRKNKVSPKILNSNKYED